MCRKEEIMESCDDKVFGDWVYCRQHVRPHSTGWCTVSNHDKIGLGIVGSETQENIKLAFEKCRDWKLPIYGE